MMRKKKRRKYQKIETCMKTSTPPPHKPHTATQTHMRDAIRSPTMGQQNSVSIDATMRLNIIHVTLPALFRHLFCFVVWLLLTVSYMHIHIYCTYLFWYRHVESYTHTRKNLASLVCASWSSHGFHKTRAM